MAPPMRSIGCLIAGAPRGRGDQTGHRLLAALPPASGDNYATPGFTESTAYEGSTRPGWTPGTVSGAVVGNSANRASFTFNATKEIFGAAIVGGGTDPSTKDDQAGGGVLFCESKFAASENVINESVLKVLVELTLSTA